MSGWNKPTSDQPAVKKGGAKAPSALKGIVAGLAIVVPLAVLLVWIFARSGEQSQGTKRTVRDTIENVGKGAKGERVARPETVPDDHRRQRRQSNETASGDALSNRNVTVSDETPGTSQKQRYESDGIDSTDQLLGMAASLAEGQTVPPMPIPDEIDKDTFLKRLREPIKIFETDNENVVHLKENMMLMREEMAKALENGEGSISQILRDHEKLMNDNNKIRNDAIAELKAIRETGDEEGAKKYLMTINLALQQMGIREMEMPMTDREIEESEDNKP